MPPTSMPQKNPLDDLFGSPAAPGAPSAPAMPGAPDPSLGMDPSAMAAGMSAMPDLGDPDGPDDMGGGDGDFDDAGGLDGAGGVDTGYDPAMGGMSQTTRSSVGEMSGAGSPLDDLFGPAPAELSGPQNPPVFGSSPPSMGMKSTPNSPSASPSATPFSKGRPTPSQFLRY